MLLYKNNKLVKYMNIIHQLHKLHKKYIQKKFEYSHAGQDVFALNLTGKNGTYIEIGAYLPIKHSNTYLLEVKNNWKGISIEFDKDLKKYADYEKKCERKMPSMERHMSNMERNMPNIFLSATLHLVNILICVVI